MKKTESVAKENRHNENNNYYIERFLYLIYQ